MSPRRTRRGVINHDASILETSRRGKKVSTPKEKSPPKKRTTRSVKTKITNDSEENRSRKVTKKSARKKPVKSQSDSLLTEDESSNESPKNSTRRRNSLISEDETPPRSRRASISLSRVDTTPKSSPLAVALSPHRSKKTPKRSPQNLGSPKSHSKTPLKLLKTPRKLEIKDSPTSSDDSKQKSSPRKTPSPKKSSPSPTVVSTRKSRSPRIVSKISLSPKKKSISPKVTTRKSRSPKRLSRISMSPKKSPSPVKSPKSPRKSPIEKKSVTRNTRRSTVSTKRENSPKNQSILEKLSPTKSNSASRSRRSLKSESPQSPKVARIVLEKLKSPGKKASPLKSRQSVSPKKVKSPERRRSRSNSSSKSPSSPKTQKLTGKKVAIESPKNLNISNRRLSRRDLIKDLTTPKELHRTLNISENIEASILRKKSSTPKVKNQSFTDIENESEPDMSDTSLINMSDVFDTDVSLKKNGTYEVDEPKTPGLRGKKTTKRSSTYVSPKRNEPESKKVRFAESGDKKTGTAKLRTGTPGHRASLKRTSDIRSKSRSPPKISRGLSDSLRRRSSSVSVVEGTPRTPANKKTANTTVNSSRKSDIKAQIESVNRLSRPKVLIASDKKPETKTPVVRKIPNFAEIHKKTFEKMESLVDAKKRVANRHVVNVTSASKSMPEMRKRSPTNNGAYNRFGFKVRKAEAVETIGKKQTTMTSEKKLNARREILKGVRTNRRFELQMKSRKSFGSK